MKAAVWYGNKTIKIEDRPHPKIGDNEVLIRVKAVSVCGSDLHAYIGQSKRRTPPLVLGHEFSGEVAKVGGNATAVVKGDRVVLEPLISCGECEPCKRGKNNICENMRLIGMHYDGAFAEYVSVPANNCHLLSETVSFEDSALTEPLAVAIHAANITPIKTHDTIVVIGSGAIGLMMVQVAKLRGAKKIIVVGNHDYQLELSKTLGADEVINAKREDLVQTIIADRLVVDAVFEVVGRQKTMQQAITIVKRGGVVTMIGMLESAMDLDLLDLTVRELTIRGSYGYTSGEFNQALKMIVKKDVQIAPIITHVFSLNEIVKGFEVLAHKNENVIKVIIKP